MQRVERAIIIRRIAFGEADWIVTAFCRGLGRTSGIARSARSSVKRFGGALEPGTQVELKFSQRPGSSLARIDEARVIRSANGAMRSLERIAAMARALDLALAFLQEGQPAPEKFDLLEERLCAISEREPGFRESVEFELGWLGLSGFCPQFERCPACEAPLKVNPRGASRAGWSFDVDRGGVLCPSCALRAGRRVRISGDALGFLKTPTGEGIDEGAARQAGALLSCYIDHVVGRPLRSWTVPGFSLQGLNRGNS